MSDELILIYTYKAKITNAMRFKFAGYKTRISKKGINGVQIRKIGLALTGALKTKIRQMGHVDTGRMVNGIKATATIGARGEMVAKIYSRMDYWKYVDGNFEILEKAMKARKWKETEKLFNKYNQFHPKRR